MVPTYCNKFWSYFTLFTRDVPLVMDMEPDEFTMDVQLFMVKEPADEFTKDFSLIMGNQSDEFTIDVPLVMDMEPDKRPECCIYKVPQILRKVNQDAYTPMLISIGPFHHGQRNLRNMEKLKVRYFKEACYRTKKSHKDLAKFIQENEVIICHCYAEIIPFSSESFVKLILLDSIFIIEHLWRTKQTWPKSCVSNDTSYSHKCEWKMVHVYFLAKKNRETQMKTIKKWKTEKIEKTKRRNTHG